MAIRSHTHHVFLAVSARGLRHFDSNNRTLATPSSSSVNVIRQSWQNQCGIRGKGYNKKRTTYMGKICRAGHCQKNASPCSVPVLVLFRKRAHFPRGRDWDGVPKNDSGYVVMVSLCSVNGREKLTNSRYLALRYLLSYSRKYSVGLGISLLPVLRSTSQ